MPPVINASRFAMLLSFRMSMPRPPVRILPKHPFFAQPGDAVVAAPLTQPLDVTGPIVVK
jgi:hypothetical protein